MSCSVDKPLPRPADQWQLRQPFGWRTVLVVLTASCLLAVSARRTELDQGAILAAEGLADAVGWQESSQVGKGWRSFIGSAFPLVLAERTAVSRIEGFQPDRLPPLAYLVRQPVREYDVESRTWVERGEELYLIEPLGYLARVTWKMLETLEIAMWGTILSVLLALPLTVLSATGYSPHRVIYLGARALCSFNRAVPELISAMFFVLMFGFGPVPGVLALGIHTSGFLGKFFADDIENADSGPQEALRSTGANRLKVLRLAVLPQVLPQCLAYIQYILERNVRTATVLGIVGAGGIGMELKGRWDMSDFGHVSTILLVVFLTVFALEHVTQLVRARLIG